MLKPFFFSNISKTFAPSSSSSKSNEMGSEMNYLEWEEEEDKDKTPTFAQWKKQFEIKNKIDPNAESIEALGKTFKHNRYSVV